MTISPTDMKSVKPTDINTIHMRYEGDVNTYWNLTLKDSRTVNFTGYQGSPEYNYEGGYLWQDNKELSEFLCEILAQITIPYWLLDTEAVDYDLSLKPTKSNKLFLATITNITIQHEDDSTTVYPDVLVQSLKF